MYCQENKKTGLPRNTHYFCLAFACEIVTTKNAKRNMRSTNNQSKLSIQGSQSSPEQTLHVVYFKEKWTTLCSAHAQLT